MAFSKWLTTNVFVLILMTTTDVSGSVVTICADAAKDDINHVVYLYVKLVGPIRATPWILLDRATHITMEGKQLACFAVDHVESVLAGYVSMVGVRMVERKEHVNVYLHYIYLRYDKECNIFEFKTMLLAVDELGPEFSADQEHCNTTAWDEYEKDLDYII